MTYQDQITAKTAAQAGANAAGVAVHYWQTRTGGRWEVSIETPSSGNYGTCKPLDPRDFAGYSRAK